MVNIINMTLRSVLVVTMQALIVETSGAFVTIPSEFPKFVERDWYHFFPANEAEPGPNDVFEVPAKWCEDKCTTGAQGRFVRRARTSARRVVQGRFVSRALTSARRVVQGRFVSGARTSARRVVQGRFVSRALTSARRVVQGRFVSVTRRSSRIICTSSLLGSSAEGWNIKY